VGGRRSAVESLERDVILILVDISGYTRFMVSNRDALLHSQVIITELIKTIIKQVEIPLEISKLEGDAVFLYAVKEEGADAWVDVRRTIGEKLIGFFEVFSDKIVELTESNVCNCSACRNVDKLRLKIIVHSGQALFYSIGRFEELSGVDVILAHRLLKNSIACDQYILMTGPAYRDVQFPAQIQVVEGEEEYEEFGRVKTYVYFPPVEELFFLDIGQDRSYDSALSKAKTGAIKLFSVALIRSGLRRLPQFHHLPQDIADAGPG
jgi:hypothetical protein